jgi:CRISPR-associated endonuclease Cas1
MSTDRIRETYTREPADTRVVVADGFGIQVKTDHGRLVVCDGIGQTRRERVVPRIGSPVQRIVIIAPNGYITLGALQWCADNGIQVMQLDRCGDMVIGGSQERSSDVTLLRMQAATPAERTLAIVKALLTVKITGQAKNLYDVLGASEAASRSETELARMHNATTVDVCRQSEARAAAYYFGSWANRVRIRFDYMSMRRIPAHWLMYSERSSMLSDGKRHALNPVNALLNYVYSLGYAEARIACIGAGLDSRLGYLHVDAEGRDSLALDVLETVRPDIDRWLMQFIASRVFSAGDFIESGKRGNIPSGTCRIVAPLTHEICEMSIQWQAPLAEAAETVRALILGTTKARRTPTRRASRARNTDMTLVQTLMPDELWNAVQPFLPLREGTLGVRPVNDRIILAMLAYRSKNGVAWRDMPARFGVNERTARLHVQKWRQLGCWSAIATAAGLPSDA